MQSIQEATDVAGLYLGLADLTIAPALSLMDDLQKYIDRSYFVMLCAQGYQESIMAVFARCSGAITPKAFSPYGRCAHPLL